MKPLLQLHVRPMLGATASVQVAPVSPLALHGVPRQAFKSVHIVLPVPAYAPLLQVQV